MAHPTQAITAAYPGDAAVPVALRGDGASPRPVRPIQKVGFCGLPVTVEATPAQAIERIFSALGHEPVLTTFINPHSFHIATVDHDYRASIAAFDFVLPDGIGITWGLRLAHGIKAARLSFDATSLAPLILDRARRDRLRVMIIGGRPGISDAAGQRLAQWFEGLPVCATMDGFSTTEAYRRAVRDARPDILICGMGAPRQEALLLQLREACTWTGWGFTCGGFLDQLQGGLQYYPVIFDRTNTRWLYRLMREPRRLWRRYMVEYRTYGRELARELGEGRPHARREQGFQPGELTPATQAEASYLLRRHPRTAPRHIGVTTPPLAPAQESEFDE